MFLILYLGVALAVTYGPLKGRSLLVSGDSTNITTADGQIMLVPGTVTGQTATSGFDDFVIDGAGAGMSLLGDNADTSVGIEVNTDNSTVQELVLQYLPTVASVELYGGATSGGAITPFYLTSNFADAADDDHFNGHQILSKWSATGMEVFGAIDNSCVLVDSTTYNCLTMGDGSLSTHDLCASASTSDGSSPFRLCFDNTDDAWTLRDSPLQVEVDGASGQAAIQVGDATASGDIYPLSANDGTERHLCWWDDSESAWECPEDMNFSGATAGAGTSRQSYCGGENTSYTTSTAKNYINFADGIDFKPDGTGTPTDGARGLPVMVAGDVIEIHYNARLANADASTHDVDFEVSSDDGTILFSCTETVAVSPFDEMVTGSCTQATGIDSVAAGSVLLLSITMDDTDLLTSQPYICVIVEET